MTLHIGMDCGIEAVGDAEHWLHEIVDRLGLPADSGLIACTHLVREPWPHVALSLALPRGFATTALPDVPARFAAAAEHARAEHAARRSGRAVRYPGCERLTGLLTVAELLTTSAIDRVTVLGGAPADPATVIDTRGFVRPQWSDGLLTLVAAPAPGGRIAPFEVPNPTPCCAQHG